MKKLIKKAIEVYARNSTTACNRGWLHEVKAPKCLIKM